MASAINPNSPINTDVIPNNRTVMSGTSPRYNPIIKVSKALMKNKKLTGMNILSGLKYVMERKISNMKLRPSRNIFIFELPFLGK